MTGTLRSPDPVWRVPETSQASIAALEGEVKAEFVIIGAGFLGLFAALELIERGKTVVLLDAKSPADNASGASAGQIGPMLLAGNRGPEYLIQKLGKERGEMLARSIAGSGRWLFDKIEKRGIDCEARKGFLCLFRSDKTFAAAESRFKEWERYGGVSEAVGRGEVQQSIASARYAGGFLLPDGGLINPAKLIVGLLAALKTEGVRVFHESPVHFVERDGGDWQVRTSNGQVQARTVIVATGLGQHSPVPELAKAAYGVVCGLAATGPLDDLGSALLPRSGPVADLDDKAVFAPAITDDGRLVVSFLAEQAPPCLPKDTEPARKRLARVFPSHDIPAFETLSWGRIAVTPDGLPRLFRTSDGIIAAGGCNGFGLTLGAVAAREAARLALGEEAEELALPITEPRPLRAVRLISRLFTSVASPLANRMGA